jgi:hypothetical protein
LLLCLRFCCVVVVNGDDGNRAMVVVWVASHANLPGKDKSFPRHPIGSFLVENPKKYFPLCRLPQVYFPQQLSFIALS